MQAKGVVVVKEEKLDSPGLKGLRGYHAPISCKNINLQKLENTCIFL